MDLWLLIITWGWCRAVANLPNIFQAGWLPLLGGCLGSSSSLRTRPTWLPFWPFLVSTRPSTRWMTWLPNTKFYTLPKTVATSLPTLNGWPTSKNDSTSNKILYNPQCLETFTQSVDDRIWKDMSLNDSMTEVERSKLAVWDYPVSDKYTKIWQSMQVSLFFFASFCFNGVMITSLIGCWTATHFWRGSNSRPRFFLRPGWFRFPWFASLSICVKGFNF